MDYAFVPPEINSARMYAGPGPSSLLAAAGSWDALSAELGTTADNYESALSSWRSQCGMARCRIGGDDGLGRPLSGLAAKAAEQTKQTALQTRAAAAARTVPMR